MKVNFKKDEIEYFLKEMEKDNDIVRLVEPLSNAVLNVNGSVATKKKCFEVWGKKERCENCTSLRAFVTKNRIFKFEFNKNHIFLVESRYLEVEDKPYILELVKDITDELFLESSLDNEVGEIIRNYNNLMVIDSLTGVFNRSYLDKQFVSSLGFCHKEDLEVNIAFIDMDNFKKINDDHGHIIGDAILNYVGTFFKVYYNDRTRNKERIVVRYGGDEFIIICTGINYEDFKSEFLTHLKEFNKKYIDTEHKEFNFSLSYGFASNSELEPNMTWNDLIDLADKRMYTLKPYKNRGNNHD